MRSLAVRLLGAKYRYIFSEHINCFSPETLARFVGRDFDVVRLASTHFNPLVIASDWRHGERVRCLSPRKGAAALLKRTTGFKESKSMLPLRWAYDTFRNGFRRLDADGQPCSCGAQAVRKGSWVCEMMAPSLRLISPHSVVGREGRTHQGLNRR